MPLKPWESFAQWDYGGEEAFGRAIDYYQKVAGAGNRGAMYELGLLYSEGSAAARNLCKAVEWYEKAALRGSTSAMFALAQLHENNHEDERAIYWYKKATDAGDKSAKRNLAGLTRFPFKRWFRRRD